MVTKSAGHAVNRTITVKAGNIDRGMKADSKHCMIADAVSQQVKGASFVSVDIQSIRFSNLKTGKRYIYLTPHVVQQAILQFDRGEMVRPFKFVLWAHEGFEKTLRSRQGNADVYRAKVRRNRNPKKEAAARAARKRAPRGAQAAPTKTREFGLRAFTADPPGKTNKRVGPIA